MDKFSTFGQLKLAAQSMKNKIGDIVGTVAEALEEIAEAIPDYSVATKSSDGLESASDKAKLDGLLTGEEYEYDGKDQDLAVNILANYLQHTVPVLQKGTVTLKSTVKFPFNNSIQTVALSQYPGTTNYVVLTQVEGFTGHMVGDIEVTGKALNGFKIAYSGSATSVTVGYVVMYAEWK